MPADDPTHDTPFTVEQYADNDANGDGIHQVTVELTPVAWRNMVGDLSRAIYQSWRAGEPLAAKLLAAGRPENDLDRADALTRLVQILEPHQPRRSWSLTPEQANQLADAFAVAGEEPSECERCGRFIEQPSQLNVATGCALCSARENGENP